MLWLFFYTDKRVANDIAEELANTYSLYLFWLDARILFLS